MNNARQRQYSLCWKGGWDEGKGGGLGASGTRTRWPETWRCLWETWG